MNAGRVKNRVEKVGALAVHGVHAFRQRGELAAVAPRSPVARALLAVIRDDFSAAERAVFDDIARVRARLYARTDEIEWSIENPVDASKLPAPMRQIVGWWAKYSSVKPHWGRVLYALVREVRPATCVELGACFGVSGLYIQAAQRATGTGRFVTFEGSRARADVARGTYRELGFEDATIVIGDFDRTLGPTLAELRTVDLAFVDGNHRLEPTLRYDAMIRAHASDRTVIVHDDIRWSGEMVDAWNQIARMPGAVFDVFRLGIVEVARQARPLRAWLGLSHLR